MLKIDWSCTPVINDDDFTGMRGAGFEQAVDGKRQNLRRFVSRGNDERDYSVHNFGSRQCG
jgi:hypothetical protein